MILQYFPHFSYHSSFGGLYQSIPFCKISGSLTTLLINNSISPLRQLNQNLFMMRTTFISGVFTLFDYHHYFESSIRNKLYICINIFILCVICSISMLSIQHKNFIQIFWLILHMNQNLFLMRITIVLEVFYSFCLSPLY